ncbi:MAG: HD domain-containing protein [Chloroflexi bacterium]|nr:HD domain-containing protein [Chloroflexota bacterium]
MKTNQWWSLRAKIVLPYILFALLLAIGAAYVGTRVVFDSIEERYVNQLIEAGKLASEWKVREENRLLATQRVLAYAEGIPEAIHASDAERLRELIYPVAVNNGEEVIHVLDRQGATLLSLYRRAQGNLEEYEFQRGDDSFKQLPFVQRVLQGATDSAGDKHAGIARGKRGDYVYVAGAIFDARGKSVGVGLVGKSLGTLARQMRETTLAQVTLYDHAGQPLASTLPQPHSLNDPAARTAALAPGQSYTHDWIASDIAYREIVGAWQLRHGDALGFVGVAFAKNFLVRISQNTWLQVLLSVLAALLLVVAIGFVISGHIAHPIVQLEQAASRVANGNLKIRVEPTGNDEVTRLVQQFNQMVSHLDQSKSDLIAAYDATLEGWVRALDLRDKEITGHSQRVTDLTLRIARALNVPAAALEHIRRGALLHDIGKMAIPDSILHKPTSLIEDEWIIMRQHPAYAVEMLQNIPFLRPAIEIPGNHHEHWDGTGYPRGLEGEEIPLAARIFAVADVWDSLLSDRPYRKAIPVEQARKIIADDSGAYFDPRVVEIFFKIVDAERAPTEIR